MSLKKQAVDGVIWTFLQQFSVQFINFGVQIVLARLLLPEMFGLIAMLSVFISIGKSLLDSGMTSSLIRTKNPDQLDYSTVFVTNFLISIAVYLLTFLGAPLVAKFYNQDILKNILRLYALSFVIHAFVAVHIAKLTKEMNFKRQMTLQVPSTILGAIVGVYMAYAGYGVWSLVWMNLAQTTAFTIQCWFRLKWRPSFEFNKRRFRYHFGFGYKLTISGLLDTVYNNIYNIVVGKFFSPAMVGFFSQAQTMRKFPVDQISSVMQKVTYPLFSNIKSDDKLRDAYKSAMKIILFIVVPIMMLLIVSGQELFLFLFGEKWLPAVPYFQVLALASITSPLSAYNLNILKVKGRSDVFLKVEIIKKSIGFIVVFAAVPFGMDILVLTLVIAAHLFMGINMFYSGRFINYPIWTQLKDCSRIYIVGLISLASTYFIRIALIDITSNLFLILLLLAIAFGLLYLLLVYIFERQTLLLIKSLIKR